MSASWRPCESRNVYYCACVSACTSLSHLTTSLEMCYLGTHLYISQLSNIASLASEMTENARYLPYTMLDDCAL